MAYPVVIEVSPSVDRRNRLTTGLRPILALPHAILAGPVYLWTRSGGVGLLGAAAYVLAIISWFSLLLTGHHPHGAREFCLYYLRWRIRSLAYMALFRDEYPPFGDGPYAASIEVTEAPSPRDLPSIALRLVLALPHLILLCLLALGWLITTVIAWFAILFTGSYPASVLPFGVGVMRWALRVEAYLLLLVDVYPPFSLEP